MSCRAGWTHSPPLTTSSVLLLLLALLAGAVSSYPVLLPAPRRRTGFSIRSILGEVSGEETLFSRSILGVSSGEQRDYLLGIKRVRRLYCNVGIGFHLQVLQDGRINGAHDENQYSLIEISTVDRGVVSLYGVSSARFVAMNSRGRLYATTVFHDECKFRESLLPNNYNAYESWAYRGSYVALSKHGRAKRGNKATTAMTVTHFLPRI